MKHIALTIACTLVLAANAHAATITVTTSVDELNSDGDCSLREAISASNTNVAVDACAAGTGVDEIILDGPYLLTLAGDDDTNAGGDLDILESVIIRGSGMNGTTIQGSGTHRPFHVVNSFDYVEFYDLQISDGASTGDRDWSPAIATCSLIAANSTATGSAVSSQATSSPSPIA